MTYIVMVLFAGATVSRDATGNVTDMANGSYAYLDCAARKSGNLTFEFIYALGVMIYVVHNFWCRIL